MPMMAYELCHFKRPQGQTQQGRRVEKYFFVKTYAQSPLCEKHIDFISSRPDLGGTGVTLVNPKSSA